MHEKSPEKILQRAVNGMLSKNRLRRGRMARLKLYSGEVWFHTEAQQRIRSYACHCKGSSSSSSRGLSCTIATPCEGFGETNHNARGRLARIYCFYWGWSGPARIIHIAGKFISCCRIPKRRTLSLSTARRSKKRIKRERSGLQYCRLIFWNANISKRRIWLHRRQRRSGPLLHGKLLAMTSRR